ncbi:MAG: hypothetical protein R3C42_04395 [Parvularculaceae bacterium]
MAWRSRRLNRCRDDEYNFRQAYVGWYDSGSKTYTGKFDMSNNIGSDKGPGA